MKIGTKVSFLNRGIGHSTIKTGKIIKIEGLFLKTYLVEVDDIYTKVYHVKKKDILKGE